MKNVAALAAVLGLSGLSSAHMEISEPAPLRSKFNDYTTDVDYSMTSPLSQDGSNYPCKGYLDLVGTDQGKSVTSYTPGESYQLTITGETIHGGGSCQVSLSFDEGSTWKAIHSYIGNCPSGTGDTSYDFTIPAETPGGEAIFAWTWFNNIGNREMYMNCAVVTIEGGSAKAKRALDDRPDMFVANVGEAGNGCTTAETKDLEFPDPGPDVTRSTPEDQTAGPVCGNSKKLARNAEPRLSNSQSRYRRSI